MAEKKAPPIEKESTNIPAYLQITIMVMALGGGGFGFYSQVVAQQAAVVEAVKHDSSPAAHFKRQHEVDDRIDKQDITISEMKSDMKATQEAVARIEVSMEQSQQRYQTGQQEIIKMLQKIQKNGNGE